MKHITRKHSLIFSLLCSIALSACGGGSGDTASSSGSNPKQNLTPSIMVTPSSVELESGEISSLSIKATDDDGEPTISIQSVSANLRAQLSVDGKTLSITANNVSAVESGNVLVVATDTRDTKLQATFPVTVKVYPKLDLFALLQSTERVKSLTVEYAKPLSFRIVDENNQDIPFISITAKDPTIAKVQTSGSLATVSSLKAGDTSIVVKGTLGTGHQYTRTLQVKAIGNQQPTLAITPTSLSLEEYQSGQLNLSIADPDNSYFQSRNLSVSSSDSAIATATVNDGNVIVNGVRTGFATITTTIVDGEFTVNSSITVTVKPETPPTITLNNNAIIELEEMSSISIPIEVNGSRATDYKPTVKIEPISGNLSDLSYSVDGNKLTISAVESTFPGYSDRSIFKVTASAHNGTKTVFAPSIALYLLKKVNGTPIFEFPNKFNSNVMIPKDGTTVISIKVNDDNSKRVELSSPELLFNDSKTGTFNVSYDDTTRVLTLNLNGFERNERFGIMLTYKDGLLGGKFSVAFRTYDLTPLDKEIIEARKVAIAKVEAARAYQLIAKMYAEHLENLGIVDSQFVDELSDQIKVDDTKYTRFSTAEYYITTALENVYNGDFNSGRASVATFKEYLNNLPIEAHEANRTSIEKINSMATQSNGFFPSLKFENTFKEVTSLQYSKFFGNDAYGANTNGKWEYSTAYKFLTAIDEKVNENTANRLN